MLKIEQKWILYCLVLAAFLSIILFSIYVSRTDFGFHQENYKSGKFRRAYFTTSDMQHGNVQLLVIASDMSRTANLTAVLWAHAVNSQKLLDDALAGNINMIEADITLGTLDGDTSGTILPVMGHPPIDRSDISLENFLDQILNYNTRNPNSQKGVKLDFKSTLVYESSQNILISMWTKMKYPVWLNADIIPGPVNPTSIPVDPNSFLTASKKFSSAVLSIGWTTQWGPTFSSGSYTKQHMDAMIEKIKSNGITMSKHEITFPVRAGIAAQSLNSIQYLFTSLSETNKLSLTIWSSAGDNVDIENLRNLIFDIGIDKVYLDVPNEVSSKLDLGRGLASSILPSLLSFSILNLLSFVISQIFQSRK